MLRRQTYTATISSDARRTGAVPTAIRPTSVVRSGCASSCFTKKRLLSCSQLRTIITRWKQVPITVGGHLDRGVTEPGLHQLERKLEPAIDPAVDAPARVEMAQSVQAGIFRLAWRGDNTCRNLCRDKSAINDVGMTLHIAPAVWEDQVKLAFWAHQTVLTQCVGYHRRQRDGALASF